MKVVTRLVEVLRRARWLLSLTPERVAAFEGLVLGVMSRCDCGRLASRMVSYEYDTEKKWVHLCAQCPAPPESLDELPYGNPSAIEAANRQGL